MLSEKEKKALARYEEQLSYPKWKFILIYGVLSWGILTALLYSLVMVLAGQYTFGELLRKNIWINLAIYMIAGILFGWLIRKVIPKSIKRLREKEQLAENS